MQFTQHAATRKIQRNFSDEAIEIILHHGRMSYAPGGVLKIFFGKKESTEAIKDLKKTIQLLEKTSGGSLIISEDRVITVYMATNS